ncbi:MAG: metal ABC transporter permease [Alphaproteobacteria bacterium]|nr:metal ABC transporter permease [Alphaproteobacteria bacterium]MCB9796925.1 metal ABC transporter permease [Alphaproteobacteria bacterium]
MSPSWEDFTLAFELFRDPILCGVIAGFALGLLAVHVVLRRMVFVSATLSQAAGLGVALGFFADIHLETHVHPTLSALGLALFTAWGLSLPVERLRLSRESLLAGAWLAAAAGALIVGGWITQEAHDIAGILFGTAVLVTPEDLRAVAAVSALVVLIGIWWQRGFVFAGFDPEGARVQGLPVRLLELTLMALITLEVAVTTRALGALPVFAFSVLPGMAALMLTSSVRVAVPLAALLGALAGGGGYMLAFFGDLPVGAAQTAAAAALTLIAAPIRLLRGGQ